LLQSEKGSWNNKASPPVKADARDTMRNGLARSARKIRDAALKTAAAGAQR
jgi:hypothetical protein